MKGLRSLYSPIAVGALRILVGAVFMVSGFSKAIDPWGFIFKMDEYLAAMAISEPRMLLLVAAIAISAFELMGGLFLLTGCYRRTIPWALAAFIAVMIPLTLWTWLADPVADCGCFGELFLLSNAATFWKNIALAIALIYLCAYNRRFTYSVFRPAIQWIVMIVSFFYTLGVALYGFNIQPMLDFRPYPVGTDLAAILDGDEEGEMGSMEFIYEKDGERESFTIDNLPDSTWEFVDRIDISYADQSAKQFSIIDPTSGDDISDEIIADEGDQLLVVIPEAARADISYSYAANELGKAMDREGGSTIGLIAASAAGIQRWQDLSMSTFPFYTVDDTTLKQLARGNMSLVYLHDGKIKWKRSLGAIPFDFVETLGQPDFEGLASLEFDDRRPLRKLTFISLGFLTVLAVFQEFIIRIWRKTKKRL